MDEKKVFHIRADRRSENRAISSAAWLESIHWKKPGIFTVKICRYTLDMQDWVVPSDTISKMVSSEILGERESVEFEELGGYWKVTLVFVKGSEYRFGGSDNNKYLVRAILFRDAIYNHIFKDKIVAKYQGFSDPVRQQLYFPKTIDKKSLKGKNPAGDPWTGHDWPTLGDPYPPGHIRNPYHGVGFYFQPGIEFTVETVDAGNISWRRFSDELGFGDRPPTFGFTFLARNARPVNRIMDSGAAGRVKAQYRWIVSDLTITKVGKERRVKQSWRSKVDPGWPIPIYKRNWSSGENNT